MAKQSVVRDGEVLIVDTDKGTYTEAQPDRGTYVPILSDILDAAEEIGKMTGILPDNSKK